ncbi:hypothetical protein BGZ80_009194, partial [Entomortierella chlamydospora]
VPSSMLRRVFASAARPSLSASVTFLPPRTVASLFPSPSSGSWSPAKSPLRSRSVVSLPSGPLVPPSPPSLRISLTAAPTPFTPCLSSLWLLPLSSMSLNSPRPTKRALASKSTGIPLSRTPWISLLSSPTLLVASTKTSSERVPRLPLSILTRIS